MFEKYISSKVVSNILQKELHFTTRIPIKVKVNIGDQGERGLVYGFPYFFPVLWDFCDDETYFFDIGANVGSFSLSLSRRCKCKNIFAFEPVSSTYDRLLENFKLNSLHVNSFNIGLANMDDTVKFGIAVGHSSGSSTDIEYLENDLKTLNQKNNLKIIECNVRKFDNIINEKIIEIDRKKKIAIKIDVQGSELEVLEGMVSFLTEHQGQGLLIVETKSYNVENVIILLNEAGFLLNIESSNLDFQSLHKDLVFTKNVSISG